MSRFAFHLFTPLLLLLLLGGVAEASRLPDFTQLVKDNQAAVVNISTVQKLRAGRRSPHGLHGLPELPPPYDEWLKRFFGEEGEGMPEGEAQSLGSGFIISPDGYILTNNHVIEDADEIIVRLNDRRELKAELVGTDERSDIALLKIEADEDLPTVKIGSSGRLEVGEWVAAIGSPFGFDSSVTVGVVSAKGRMLPNENYVSFIQTDVAINPGNSGGPLFNLDGEVVGVNSQIFSRTGGYMGLSFAIPIDLAMNVVRQLKEKGRVSRGWLGIYFQEVTRDLAESFGMDKPRGALVAKVVPDSPAEKAGLRVGDVIVSYDGKPVDDPGVLPPLVGQTPVGKKVQVEVIRDGEERTFRVTIQELPDADERGGTPHREGGSSFDKRLKLGVGPIDDETRESLGVEDEEGVVVNRIQPGPAFDAGIRKGDVIVMIDGKRVEDVKGFRRIVGELEEGATVPVLVHRSSGPLFLALKVPD